MADRSITVALKATVTGLVNGFKTAEQAASDWSSKTLSYIDKNEQHINTLSKSAGLVGAALTGFAVLAVKAFSDFDSAMSSVQAATLETADNMALLRQAALDAGADTVYSATESAGAIEELAKAGISTADILNGALTGALDLASAGSMDVGDAAEIAASALTQFGLSGDDVTHVADLLAAGAGKAQGDVSDLGDALNNVGTVASNTGYSIEETTGFLAAMASYGLTGAEAGTQLKSMLQSLQAPSSVAQKALDELGLSLYDNAGNTKSLTEFVGEYKASLEGKTQAEKDSYNATIFGSYGINAANVAYKEGADGIQTWIDAVDDQGYAAEVAATKLDNLAGDWEGLSGSIETALIGIGEGADGPLRALVQKADSVVDAFNALPDGAKEATLAITGGSGLVLLGVAGLGKLLTSVANVKTAMDSLKISAGKATASVVGIGAVLALGTFYLTEWAEAAQESEQNTEDFTSTLDDATGAITASTEELVAQKVAASDAGRIYSNLGGDIGDLTGAVLGNADAIDRMNTFLDQVPKESFFGITSEASGVTTVRDGVQGLTDDLGESQDAFLREQEALAATETSTDETASALETYSASVEDGTATVDEYTDALEELISAQSEAAGVVMDLYSAQNAAEQAYADATAAISENGATLDVTTEKGRANREALIDIADAGWDLIESMQQNGSTQEELQGQIQTTRDRFVAVAESMGASKEDAEALADSLNLIPSNVSSVVDVDTATANSKLDTLLGKMTTLGFGSSAALSITKSATGGAVSGPGTGTSDTAGLFALSNGEHVLTASDVTKLGGQGAVYALRSAIQSGRSIKGYAAGGAVVPTTQYVAPAYMTAPSGVAASAGVTYQVTQYITTTDPVAAGVAGVRRVQALGA